MANSRQAKKRARQSVKRRALRSSQRALTRTCLKKVLAAIDAKDAGVAQTALKEASVILDRMADKGVIHRNKAARHKSRLNDQVKALA